MEEKNLLIKINSTTLKITLNIFYKESSFERRLYLGSTKIKTPFCVVIGDDELHEPTALKKSISFLKKILTMDAV